MAAEELAALADSALDAATLAGLDAALPPASDDPPDAQPMSSPAALLARLPRLLAPDAALGAKLDGWADGLQAAPPAALLDEWRVRTAALLRLAPRLLAEAAARGGQLLTESHQKEEEPEARPEVAAEGVAASHMLQASTRTYAST